MIAGQGLKPYSSSCSDVAAKQAAEEVAYFVILSGAKNLS